MLVENYTKVSFSHKIDKRIVCYHFQTVVDKNLEAGGGEYLVQKGRFLLTGQEGEYPYEQIFKRQPDGSYVIYHDEFHFWLQRIDSVLYFKMSSLLKNVEVIRDKIVVSETERREINITHKSSNYLVTVDFKIRELFIEINTTPAIPVDLNCSLSFLKRIEEGNYDVLFKDSNI